MCTWQECKCLTRTEADFNTCLFPGPPKDHRATGIYSAAETFDPETSHVDEDSPLLGTTISLVFLNNWMWFWTRAGPSKGGGREIETFCIHSKGNIALKRKELLIWTKKDCYLNWHVCFFLLIMEQERSLQVKWGPSRKIKSSNFFAHWNYNFGKFLSRYTYTAVCAYIHSCAYIPRGQPPVSFLRHCPPFLRQDFSLPRNSPSRLGWQASEPAGGAVRGMTVSASPGHHQDWIFHMGSAALVFEALFWVSLGHTQFYRIIIPGFPLLMLLLFLNLHILLPFWN